MVYTVSGKDLNLSEVDKGCVWKQCVLCFIVSLPYFTHGVESNNLTLSTHAGFFKLFHDVPWTTTAFILASLVSGLPLTYIIDKFGRRCGIFLIVLLQGASCVPLLLPPNTYGDIILHVLTGVSTAGLVICIPIYVREVATIESRGCMVVLMTVMTTAGYLVTFGMTSDSMLYLTAALVVLQFLLLLLVLESPSYLVKVGKFYNATKNMSKLRCLPETSEYIASEINRLKDESDRAKSNGSGTNLRLFKNKVWLDETKIGLVLYTTTVFNGSIIFLDHEKALEQLKTSLDFYKIMVPICLFTGGVTGFILLRLLDRRYVFTFGTSLMVFSLGILAVFAQTDMTLTSSRWLPVAALSVVGFGYGVSWSIPTAILVEMFNLEIRATLLGLIYTYSQILRIIQTHSFDYLEENMGIHVLLYIYSFINMFGAVYAVFIVPTIKGKDVRQIEKQMRRIPLLNL